VADVVEAMATHRPYRAALGLDKALEEITRNKGVLYDLDAADACLHLFRKKGYENQRVVNDKNFYQGDIYGRQRG